MYDTMDAMELNFIFSLLGFITGFFTGYHYARRKFT
jgi:hypothetical protein